MDSDGQDTNVPRISPFESIRRVADDGSEYWSARDLAKILAYDNYRNFLKVISKARVACEQSGQAFSDHFVEADEMVEIGSKAKRRVEDFSYRAMLATSSFRMRTHPNPSLLLGKRTLQCKRDARNCKMKWTRFQKINYDCYDVLR